MHTSTYIHRIHYTVFTDILTYKLHSAFFDNIHKHSETFTYTDIHIHGICYTKIIDITTHTIQNYT